MGSAAPPAALLLLLSFPAIAVESIHHFDSDIVVGTDGWIEVTETIVIRAEGKNIRRGLVRDYPTRYEDRIGNQVEVSYEPLSLLRNGAREDFHSEPFANGVRTYFGNAEQLLETGEHTYTFRYRAGRMLGFFEDHDELYWNAVPTGSIFPVESAAVSVSFAFDLRATDIATTAYTGFPGERGRDYRGNVSNDGTAHFETTRVLPPGAGLSVVVSWPKGYISEPTWWDRARWLLSDNRNLLIAVLGFLAALAWSLFAWLHFGRDPPAGVIFPRYTPPENFSPASLRYIEKMRYDNTAMTAAIVNLAVKGYLRIVDSDDVHTLHKREPAAHAPPMAAGEQSLYDALFGDDDVVVLKESEHKKIAAARSAHGKALRKDYGQRYFRSNGAVNLPGLLIGIATAVVALSVGSGPTLAVGLVIVSIFVTIVFFAIIMKQPTGMGRQLLDELHGFREYLAIAEKDEMNLRNPPEKTPTLFEKYLPFALAIGVEQAWAEKFEAVLSASGRGDTAYQPSWYSGSWHNGRLAASMRSLSSGLSSTISSAMSPPGSSSGGGGGGSSGGGGGGGGVGGW